MSHRILSCGEVLWDLFPDGARFGGAPANFACHAALLGGSVTMLSAVGDDPRGREAVKILRGFGIGTSLIQIVARSSTGSVGVRVDAAGRPAFEIHAGSAWDKIAWTPEIEAGIANADAIYFGTLGQRGEISRATILRALGLAKERGIVRALDVNLRAPFFDAALIRESVEQASVLKLSDEELPAVAKACGITCCRHAEDALRAMLTLYDLEVIAMTRGADGAMLVSADETISQPGIPAVVRDTVGAGDSFTAALVIGLLRGNASADIARTACETAAAVCAHDGAVPGAKLRAAAQDGGAK